MYREVYIPIFLDFAMGAGLEGWGNLFKRIEMELFFRVGFSLCRG